MQIKRKSDVVDADIGVPIVEDDGVELVEAGPKLWVYAILAEDDE